MDLQILDDNNDIFDAAFSLKRTRGGSYELFIESCGGKHPRYNRDYSPAFTTVLERLADIDARLWRVEVRSGDTKGLPLKERTIKPARYELPLHLAGVADLNDLRAKLGTGAKKIGQAPGASGGNSQKRLRLLIKFERGAAPTLETLAKRISRAHRRTTRLSASAGASRKRSARSRRSNKQGYEQDPKVRKAIECYAMDQAEAYYERLGWTATRVHNEKLGYDISFSKGRRHLCVEVKGTKGSGRSVIVTANEVRYAHQCPLPTVLFVVAKIEVNREAKPPICSGGELAIYDNWDPHQQGELTIKTFDYKVPPKASERRKLKS